LKSVTADWLKSADADLETVRAILENPSLTAIVAFHSQQCVEKCLKAVLEEFDVDAGRVARSHNLLALKAAVETVRCIDLDEDILSLLNKLYVGARYPGDFGLLPEGAPTLEDAREFAQFAAAARDKAVEIISSSGFD
jgi:HEPN domain-containing protein